MDALRTVGFVVRGRQGKEGSWNQGLRLAHVGSLADDRRETRRALKSFRVASLLSFWFEHSKRRGLRVGWVFLLGEQGSLSR